MDNSLDTVNKPVHYTDGKIEVIDFIEDKKLNFHLGNVVKYISRAGKKDPNKTLEDLQKAKWYLEREISRQGGVEPVEEPVEEIKTIGRGEKVTPALLDMVNSLEENIFPENLCKLRLMDKLKMSDKFELFNHYYNNSDKCYELYIKFKDERVVIKL